ncbi:MAG: protein kinase [Phycisphaerae bacterium]|nr:protein kinase [Phycisphaerae bacterium]
MSDLARARDAFVAVLAAAPSDRPRLLAQLCADDPDLLLEVQTLLEHHQSAEGFLEPAAPAAARAREQARAWLGAPSLGERVGRYTLTSFLGAGGMGLVYVAQQDEPRRTVALKIIRPGAAGPSALRRFRHESQALALLHHPGIAQVFEAGTAETPAGPLPFFAMELVHGVTLADWVRSTRPGLRERLALIASVCDAVAHAHNARVVHRDLKPANILVDSLGEPKILDFGVARLADADGPVSTLQTETGQLVGTLAYMSPEQVAGDPRAVGPTTDVYALGVMLYELLTGRLPLDVARKSLPEIARLIRDDEPEPLGSIDRSLKGDVETIVAKAMDKDPKRRYPHAGALADDLRRFLRDEPVRARRASTLYQWRKFARRNRPLVWGLAGVFAAILIGAILASWQAVVATRASARADSQAESLRQSLYFNRIGFAQSALNAGDVARAAELLDECPPDLRRWEWGYLAGQIDQSTRRLVVAEPGDVSASLAADRLLVSRLGGVSRLIDLASGSTLQQWPVGVPTGCLALSPDGRRCLLAPDSGALSFVDPATPSPLWSFPVRDGRAYAAAFSPDGTRVAVGLVRTAIVLDAATGTLLTSIHADDTVTALAFAPSGSTLATGSLKGRVDLWDHATGRPIASASAHTEDVRALSFSADARVLASAANDGFVRCWRTPDLEPVSGERPQPFPARAVALSPDGSLVASGGSGNLITIADVASGATLRTLPGHSRSVIFLAYPFHPSPDTPATLLSVGRDGEARWWSRAGRDDPDFLAADRPGVYCVALAPDGQSAFAAADAGIEEWDLAHSSLRRTIPITGGTRWLVLDHDRLLLVRGNRRLEALDLRTSEILWSVPLPAADGVRLALQPTPLPGIPQSQIPDADRRLLVVGDRWAWVVSTRTGETIAQAPADSDPPCSGAWLASGLVALGCESGAIRLWDPARGALVRTTKAHEQRVGALLSLPDGRLLAGSEDGLASIWDASLLGPPLVLRGHKAAVLSLAATPRGDRVFTAGMDNSVRVWETRGGDGLLMLVAPRSIIPSLAADASTLVCAGQTPRVWRSAPVTAGTR